jgi:hypothetical protein
MDVTFALSGLSVPYGQDTPLITAMRNYMASSESTPGAVAGPVFATLLLQLEARNRIDPFSQQEIEGIFGLPDFVREIPPSVAFAYLLKTEPGRFLVFEFDKSLTLAQISWHDRDSFDLSAWVPQRKATQP